ncbi:28S ribosomal protein S15, mitochondrial [Cephus cinctus]|uniref:Small ribosomal subunit protein uS15m n=1 Tax=Cephus cinctus TaxID=211228 RepID=A0AAJ7C7S9_CEPCN|nr:28S ribosomal protein S15, mitochondrial [Cephus cinctus]
MFANNVRCVPVIVGNILKISNTLARNYAFKSNLKIKWVRPEKPSCISTEISGDLGLDVKVDPNEYCKKYWNSKELEDADDIVKKMFTLDFNKRKTTVVVQREKITSLVKNHFMDTTSMETIIAKMTNQILQLQEYMKDHPRNLPTKTHLKELIEKRKKFLGYLRQWDYKRFEWLLEKLNIIYKPHPHQYLPVTRKDSLRKLTTKHCDKLVQEKLDAYRKELEEEQKIFFKEKAEKLAFIRAEEIACGVTPTVTEEQIEDVRKKAAELQ